MEKANTHSLVKRKLFFILLFFMIAFTGNAQWTYTTTVQQSGKCIPYPTTGTIPYNTKSACEAARQYDLSQSGSDWSVFGDGSCTTIITCTPCMGSDPGSQGQGGTSGSFSFPGQVNPGDANINSILEGKSFFTSHQSQAFEDWALEYKQLLASYGITSVMDKNFIVPKIPLTEDKYFNAQYTTLAANFKPKVAPADKPKTKAPSTEESEFPSITMPIMGGSPMTQEDRERQNLPTSTREQYIDMMTYVRPGSGIEESTPATTELSDSKEYKKVEAFLDEIGEYKVGKLPAFTGKLLLNTVNETDKLIRDMTLNNKYSEDELTEMNTVKVIVNNVTTEMITNKIKETVKEVKQDLGLNYLGSKFGEATKAGAEFGLKLKDKAATLKGIWTAE